MESVVVKDDRSLPRVSPSKPFSIREEQSEGSCQNDKVQTAFVWNSEASAVAVVFAEDGIKPRPLMKTRDGHFASVMELSPGTYRFRFLVDGEWRVDKEIESKVSTTDDGVSYHEIVVSNEVPDEPRNSNARSALNREVILALAMHKEELPPSVSAAETLPYHKQGKKSGSLFRRPLALLGSKQVNSRSNTNEATTERPTKPPKQGDRHQKFAQAAENARERQEVARAMVERGMYDGALALYKVALTIRKENGLFFTPANAHCHAEMAMVFMMVQELDLAEAHLKLALNVWKRGRAGNFCNEPRHRLGDLYHYLAVVLDRQGKTDEAAKHFATAIKIYTEQAEFVDENRVASARRNMTANASKLSQDGEL